MIGPKWDRNKIAIILRKYYHFQIHGKIVDKGEMWKKGGIWKNSTISNWKIVAFLA